MHFVFLVPQDAKTPFNTQGMEKLNSLAYYQGMRNATLVIEQHSPTPDSRIRIEIHNPDSPIPWGALYKACMRIFHDTGVNPLRERGRAWFRKLRWVVDESDTFRPDLHPVDHCITERTSVITLRGHLFLPPRSSSALFSTRAEAIKLFERELDAHLKACPLPTAKPKAKPRSKQ